MSALSVQRQAKVVHRATIQLDNTLDIKLRFEAEDLCKVGISNCNAVIELQSVVCGEIERV